MEEKIAEGLDPTAMAIAPDGRVFIAEKNGRIRIVEGGQLLSGAFLQLEVDNYNEQGLNGIVLSPNFEQDNFVVTIQHHDLTPKAKFCMPPFPFQGE